MGEKDVQTGMILIAVSAFFLFSAIGLFDYYNFFDERLSTIIAYIAVAVGVYMILKK